MDLHQNIISGGYLLDSEHFDSIADSFLLNLNSDLEECKTVYLTLKTDDERIKLFEKYFCWKPIPEEYFTRYQKNSVSSEFFRQTGNVSYSYTDIPAALRCYNLSICFAPNNSQQLALGYANRSALFLQIDENELALVDINLSLQYEELDKNIKNKILLRKSKCEQILSSKETKNCLNKDQQGKIFCQKNFEKLRNPSKILIGAEESVGIKFDKIGGRRLLAKENIKAGTSVLIDKPYVTLLDKMLNWDTEHCAGCTKPILGGLPCQSSTFGLYCDDACRSSHKRLPDNLLQYVHSTASIHDSLLALHIINKADNFKIHSESSKFPGFMKGKYDQSSYNAVYNLVSHKSVYDFEKKNLPLEFKSLFLASLMKQLVPELTAPENLASLFLHHFESLQYNVLSLCEWRTRLGPISQPYWNKEAKKQRINPTTSSYGIGVFPLVALCNHSCDPNTIFVKNTKIEPAFLVTSRQIFKGEEICISYKAPFTRMRFEDRRSYLLQNYKFVCACSACEKGLSVEDVKKEAVLLKASQNGISGYADKLMEIGSNLQHVEILVKEERFTDAFKLLADSSQFLSSYFISEFELMQICQDLFRRIVVHLIHL